MLVLALALIILGVLFAALMHRDVGLLVTACGVILLILILANGISVD